MDDQPLANAAIFRFLNNYGIVIDQAYSTEEAESALKWSSNAYEVVISDMERGEDKTAGLDLLEVTQEMNKSKAKDELITVLIFINKLDTSKGTPPGAKLITNRVDELFEEIFGVIEKKQLRHMKAKA